MRRRSVPARRRPGSAERDIVIGLLLVGHSADVVIGLRAMLRQAAPRVAVEIAGGLSGGRLGTSGIDVAAALHRALEGAAPDPVVVFLDLGSAAMALDLALDELDVAEASRVHVTEAPFVEGAVLAALAAEAGDDIDAVLAAAGSAVRMPKLLREVDR